MNFRQFIKKIHPLKHPVGNRPIPRKFKNGRIDWSSVPLGTPLLVEDWIGDQYRGTLVAVHSRTLELNVPGRERPFFCLRGEVKRIG